MYEAYGLLWQVPWRMPLWPAAPATRESPGARSSPSLSGLVNHTVRVEFGDNPGLPAGCATVGPYRAFDDSTVWLDVPEIGTYQVRGTSVTFHPYSHLDHNDAVDELRWRTLAGPVASLVLRNVGLVPIHGSAVRHDQLGTAVLVGGACTGVSTLAASLLYQGFDLIGDELLALAPRVNEPPVVWGGQNRIEVPCDSGSLLAKLFGTPSPRIDERILMGATRWTLPISATCDSAPVDAFFVLTTNAHDQPNSERVTGVDRLGVITYSDWHRQLRQSMGFESDDFATAGIITKDVAIHRVHRLDTPTIHVGRISRLITARLRQLRTVPAGVGTR